MNLFNNTPQKGNNNAAISRGRRNKVMYVPKHTKEEIVEFEEAIDAFKTTPRILGDDLNPAWIKLVAKYNSTIDLLKKIRQRKLIRL